MELVHVARRADPRERRSGVRPASPPSGRLSPRLGLLTILGVLALAVFGQVPALAASPATAGMGHQAPAVCSVPCSTVAAGRHDERSTRAEDDDAASSVPSYPGSADLPAVVRKQSIPEGFLHQSPPKVPLHLRNQLLRN